MFRKILSRHIGPFSLTFFRSYLAVLLPLCILPVLWLDPSKQQECKCLYVVLLMALYWLFQVVPLVITAFLPLVLFPLLQIQPTSEVSPNYFSASSSLFLAGLIFAITIEDSGLDKRVAISFLSITGSKPKALLFGIMVVTSVLSLLVSNTATTAMMIPILKSILESTSIEKEERIQERYKNGLLMAIAYASNIGGTGFLTGTPPNLVAPPILNEVFKEDGIISFVNWAAFAIPLMLVNLVLAGLWLYYFFDFAKYERAEFPNQSEDIEMTAQFAYKTASEAIKKRRTDMGPISFRELSIALIFTLTILLWFTKSPRVFPGWGDIFTGVSVSSSTPAFLMIVLLFLLPRTCKFWPFIGWHESPQSSEALITWKAVEKKLPWGIMFLLGGGTALAMGTRKSGLSNWLVETVGPAMRTLNSWVINLIFCIVMTFATEFISNSAAANIMVPILVDLSISICENPLYLVVSTVICSSYAFMIPVATAPNALVFEASTLSQLQMMTCGLMMNSICILTTTVAINTYGSLVFQFHSPPTWLSNYHLAQNHSECFTALNISTGNYIEISTII